MGRDAWPKLRSCQTAKLVDRRLQLGHTGVTLCWIGAEDLLIHDASAAEIVQRAHDGSRAAGFRDACHAARPAIADAGDRRLVKRLRARRLLQLADATDPFHEFRFVVPRATAHMRELEVRVAV